MKKWIDDIKSSMTVKKGSAVTTVILCIVAATIFWFFNSLNKEYSTNINYPIEFVYDDQTYMAVTELPEEILLNVTGVGWNLLRKSIGLKVPSIRILIENPQDTEKIPGTTLPGIVTDQVPDITLNYILTDTLFINLDKRTTQKFKVSIDSLGIPLQDGFVITSPISISVDSVLLTGPQSKLNELGNTIYLTLDESDIDDDFSEDIQIRIPDNHLIQRDPPTVSIEFSVHELKRASLQLPITLKPMNEKFSLDFASTDSLSTIFFEIPLDTDVPDISEFTLGFDPDAYSPNDSTTVLKLLDLPKSIYHVEMDSTRFKVYPKE